MKKVFILAAAIASQVALAHGRETGNQILDLHNLKIIEEDQETEEGIDLAEEARMKNFSQILEKALQEFRKEQFEEGENILLK